MNKQLIHRIRLIATAIILLALMLLFLIGCMQSAPEIEPEPELTANDYVYNAFDEWYLWYDQLPDIDPNQFETQHDLIDAIKVEQDHWSFSYSLTAIRKLIEEAEDKSLGADYKIDLENKVRVTHVYANSPMGRFGVKRGWIVESANGFDLSNNSELSYAVYADTGNVEIKFTNLTGQSITSVFKQESFSMNTVLYSDVLVFDEHKIGYLVFDSFWEVSKDELYTVFENFQSENIDEIIVDLRYNGGGLNSIAELLIGMIGGDKVDGQVISNQIHNNKKSNWNSTEISNYNGPQVNIDRVHFITTRGTASASEIVINALKPYMEVVLVGSDTQGKLVGMYVLSIEKHDLAVMPVCFKLTNGNGFGEYFDGFAADIAEVDDLSHDWGNPEEAMLKAAISNIIEPTALASSTFKNALINQQYLLNPNRRNLLIKRIE